MYKQGSIPKALIVASLLLIASCNVNSGGDFKEKKTFRFQKDANLLAVTTQRQISQDSLITVFNVSIESGNDLVFTYQRNVIPPQNVQDGGLTETVVFQVPAGQKSFTLDSNSFDAAPAFYRRSCFCPLSGAGFKITDGTITGEKISAVHWNIKADIVIETPQGSFDINFNQPFFLN